MLYVICSNVITYIIIIHPAPCITTNHMLQTVRLLLMLFLQSVQSALQCDYSYRHLQHNNITALKYQLQSQMRGLVLAPWDHKYELFRKIHNAACCQKPLLIARPLSQKVDSLFVLYFTLLYCVTRRTLEYFIIRFLWAKYHHKLFPLPSLSRPSPDTESFAKTV